VVEGERVIVGDTPTPLNVASGSDGVYGSALVIRPKVSAIDLGGAGVTSGGGFEALADEAVSIDLDEGEVVYGIAPATTTVTVHVFRRGV
jgi:hypothetical protein